MKVQKISSKVCPISGISHVDDEFEKSILFQRIDNESGIRVSTRSYSYDNVIKDLYNMFYCGGNCVEDIQTPVGTDLKLIVRE